MTIPTDIVIFYALSGRCAAGVAYLRGYDIDSDEVPSVVLLSLLGSAGAAVAAEVGFKIGNKAAMAVLQKLPGTVLIAINKKVGFRLLTKLGEKGLINLVKFVPLAGGVVVSTINVAAMKTVVNMRRRTSPRSSCV